MAIGLITAGMKITAALLNSIAPLAILKQADQSKVNNTIGGDNTLIIPVVASAQYFFLCYINYEGATLGTGDIQFGWILPGGATMRYACLNHDLSNVLQFETRLGSGVISAGSNGAGNLRALFMAGTVFIGGTAGNMQFQWAQNTTNAGVATIVHAQSAIAAWRTT